jgi:dihydroorotase
MPLLVFKNFRLVDETTDAPGSVIIEDGIIKEVFTDAGDGFDFIMAEKEIERAALRADTVLDGGCTKQSGREQNYARALMPAFVELHAHFREAAAAEKQFPAETIESACLAAAAGGYGTAVCMANTVPVTDTIEAARSVKNRSDALGLIDLYPALSLTKGMEGKALSLFQNSVSFGKGFGKTVQKAGFSVKSEVDFPKAEVLENPQLPEITLLPGKGENPNYAETVRLLSEDGKDVADDAVFLLAMEEARRAGIPVSCHCDLGGENNATQRALALGEKARCRLHIAHVSTKEAAAMIRQAKKDNPLLSCEVTPHHIALTQETAAALGAESHGRVNPPLRTEEDRQALIAAIMDGTADAIATDHAPHSQAGKEKGAPGFTGLETAFAVCNTALVIPGHITLSKLSSLMSAAPARILGLDGGNGNSRSGIGRGRIAPGFRADFTIADTAAAWTVEPAAFFSRGKNSPFTGKVLNGRIIMTIRGGRIVFDRGNF